MQLIRANALCMLSSIEVIRELHLEVRFLNLEATGKLTIRSLRAKPLQVIQLERKRLLQDKIFTRDIFCVFDYGLQISYSTHL